MPENARSILSGSVDRIQTHLCVSRAWIFATDAAIAGNQSQLKCLLPLAVVGRGQIRWRQDLLQGSRILLHVGKYLNESGLKAQACPCSLT